MAPSGRVPTAPVTRDARQVRIEQIHTSFRSEILNSPLWSSVLTSHPDNRTPGVLNAYAHLRDSRPPAERQRLPGASLDHGNDCHGHSDNTRRDCVVPAGRAKPIHESFLGRDRSRCAGNHAGFAPAGARPDTSRNERQLRAARGGTFAIGGERHRHERQRFCQS
jgi:hypothetical protein